MKYLTTNFYKNFYKSKLFLFHIYCGWHEFNSLKRRIYVNKATLLILDILLIKFNYFIGTNILQIVFDFITCKLVNGYFLGVHLGLL